MGTRGLAVLTDPCDAIQLPQSDRGFGLKIRTKSGFESQWGHCDFAGRCAFGYEGSAVRTRRGVTNRHGPRATVALGQRRTLAPADVGDSCNSISVTLGSLGTSKRIATSMT